MEKILSSEYVTVGELVRLTGCRYSTLKYYTEEEILPFEQEEENLTRRYKREESIERISLIQELKKQETQSHKLKKYCHEKAFWAFSL